MLDDFFVFKHVGQGKQDKGKVQEAKLNWLQMSFDFWHLVVPAAARLAPPVSCRCIAVSARVCHTEAYPIPFRQF